MNLLVALAGSLAIGAWIAACCSLAAMLGGVRPHFGAFWRGSILAGLGVMLLAELVAIL